MLAREGAGAEVLLTGATGFLGKVVLHELLRRRAELGVARVHCLVRGKGGVSAEDRFAEEVLRSACFSRLEPGWQEAVRVVAGDVGREAAGLASERRTVLCDRLTHVVHCAASVEFHLPIAQAAAANTTSALHVLELARACPRLASLVSVSTAYVTPHPGGDGRVEEVLAPLHRPARELYEEILAGRYDATDAEAGLLATEGHPNTYTFTKCLAEHLLAERRGGVPLTLVRPSIISASLRQPFPGWIDSPAAFGLFAMMVGSGRMRLLLARPQTKLDIVPVDFVAGQVVDAAFAARAVEPAAGAPPRIRHAVVGPERSPSVALCGERVVRFFERNPLGDGRGPVAGIRYVGPDGLRYRLWHFLQHERRRESRDIADRLAETSRQFAYFTHHSFRFEAEEPFDAPGFDAFDAGDYIDLVSRGIFAHLLGGDTSEVTLAGRGHRRPRGDLGWALTQPEGNAFLRATAWLVAKALRRGIDRATVDVDSFRRARAAVPEGATIVLAPSHRSYMDFVLMSFLCFARPDLGIRIPHIAAAVEFARIPLLGWLFRKLHAFYLERGRGREDKALTRAVHGLVQQGEVLEFFIEGRRSRSRQLLPPRRGLLRSLQSTGRPVALLPIAITYDHVPEQATFVDELSGAPKPPMRLRDLLGWSARLLRGRVELGRIHVACGDVVNMDLGSDVHAVTRDLMAQLQQGMVATTHHLRCFLRASGAPVELPFLVEALERRGGRVLEVPRREQEVPAVIERCMRYQFAHRFHAEALRLFAGNPAVRHHVERNGFAPGAAVDVEAELAEPRVRALLRALFAPVAADYAATARRLDAARRAGEPVPSPAEVVRSLPGAHLPDVEGACEDLIRLGVLAEGEDGVREFGPEAHALRGYAEACARGVGEKA